MSMRKIESRCGMSLVEVMIAMVIFMMLALGITQAVLQSTRIAQNNIVRNTAYTAAQGYLEQIKSLPFQAILDALDDPEETPLPTMSISALDAVQLEVSDSLFLDGPDEPLAGQEDGSNFREILIDLREVEGGEDPREITMDTWFDVDIEDVSHHSYSHAITIRFEARLRGFSERRVAGVLRGMRADVQRTSAP
ncbi:MAG: prepilin-type N-terminal cleavage/methylation domain-containing protein [Puniceicoccaceae bacterium]